MSCLYVVWDVIDDTITRKVNASDASAFAHVCGCCPSQGTPSPVYLLQILTTTGLIVWGVLWLVIAIIFFAAGVLVGLVAFKESAQQQKEDASHFLPVPGSKSGAASMTIPSGLAMLTLLGMSTFLGL